jgi:hypothetical protein
MLKLVDENRPGTGDDEAGVAGRRRSRVRAVKIKDRSVKLSRERSEQGAFAYGARSGEDYDGLFLHAPRDDFGESARTQPARRLHALQNATQGVPWNDFWETLRSCSGKLSSSLMVTSHGCPVS